MNGTDQEEIRTGGKNKLYFVLFLFECSHTVILFKLFTSLQVSTSAYKDSLM